MLSTNVTSRHASLMDASETAKEVQLSKFIGLPFDGDRMTKGNDTVCVKSGSPLRHFGLTMIVPTTRPVPVVNHESPREGLDPDIRANNCEGSWVVHSRSWRHANEITDLQAKPGECNTIALTVVRVPKWLEQYGIVWGLQ